MSPNSGRATARGDRRARRATIWTVTLAVASAGVLALPGGASAATPVSPSESIAAIGAVGGLQGVVPSGAVDANSASVTNVAGTTVDIPKTAADPMNITTAAGDQIKMAMPATATGVRTASGSVVFPDAATGTSTSAQALASGDARMLITIPGPSAPREYAVPVTLPANTQAILLDDGGIAFADLTGRVFGGLNAPIALDRNGQRLPTHFNIAGGKVTQVIEFGATTAFPIVADHWLSKLVGYIVKAVVTVVKYVVNGFVTVVKAAAKGCVTGGIKGFVTGLISGGWAGAVTGAVTGCIGGAIAAVGGGGGGAGGPARMIP